MTCARTDFSISRRPAALSPRRRLAPALVVSGLAALSAGGAQAQSVVVFDDAIPMAGPRAGPMAGSVAAPAVVGGTAGGVSVDLSVIDDLEWTGQGQALRFPGSRAASGGRILLLPPDTSVHLIPPGTRKARTSKGARKAAPKPPAPELQAARPQPKPEPPVPAEAAVAVASSQAAPAPTADGAPTGLIPAAAPPSEPSALAPQTSPEVSPKASRAAATAAVPAPAPTVPESGALANPADAHLARASAAGLPVDAGTLTMSDLAAVPPPPLPPSAITAKAPPAASMAKVDIPQAEPAISPAPRTGVDSGRLAAPAMPATPAPVKATPAKAMQTAALPPEPPALPESAAQPVAAGFAPGVTRAIAFATGQAALPENGEPILTAAAQALSGDPRLRIELKAYAAGEPNNESKARRLSLSRALAVRSYLIKEGVQATRIDVRALGSRVPDGAADRVDVSVVSR